MTRAFKQGFIDAMQKIAENPATVSRPARRRRVVPQRHFNDPNMPVQAYDVGKKLLMDYTYPDRYMTEQEYVDALNAGADPKALGEEFLRKYPDNTLEYGRQYARDSYGNVREDVPPKQVLSSTSINHGFLSRLLGIPAQLGFGDLGRMSEFIKDKKKEYADSQPASAAYAFAARQPAANGVKTDGIALAKGDAVYPNDGI